MYGAAYVPFAALSSLPQRDLALTSLSCWICMVIVMTLSRSWQHVRLTAHTLACGTATCMIILSTIVGYGLPGTSMVTMAVAMRGGVLTLAPVLDLMRGHRLTARSALALALALAAVTATSWGRPWGGLTGPALAVVGVYLLSYAVRLALYGRTKGDMVQTRALLCSDQALAVSLALLGTLAWQGLGQGLGRAQGLGWAVPVAVGCLSQLTGVFGSMVLAGAQHHVWCVVLNRSASTLAVLVASLIMGRSVSAGECVAVGLLLAAVMVGATAPKPVR